MHEIEIFSLFFRERIDGRYVRPILVMLTEEQLGDKSNFKKELGTYANDQHKEIERQLFEDKHALCFQELQREGSKPWHYFSIKQKMNKKEKKFKEKDDIDKYVENIVQDEAKLQKVLIDELTIQQWLTILLICADESRLQSIINFMLDYRDTLVASSEQKNRRVHEIDVDKLDEVNQDDTNVNKSPEKLKSKLDEPAGDKHKR